MQIIDLTPSRNAEGKVSPIGLLQGILKYGLSYKKMLDAQDTLQTLLQKHLGKQFYLLRNLVLPGSQILVPFILIGPAGMYVIMPVAESGIYQAQGAEWGTLEKERFKPASINLLKKTANLTRAVQVYLKRQSLEVDSIEGLLMAVDPGMHIMSNRPVVRVLMYDAIPGFARSLSQTRGQISSAQARKIIKRLQNPRSKDDPEEEIDDLQPEAFFTPSEGSDNADLSQAFAFEEDDTAEEEVSEPPVPPPVPRPAKRTPRPKETLPLGLSQKQWLLLIGMFVLEILLIFGMLLFVLLSNP